ncbi:MAG: hypothetical protein CVT48_01815 [Thermoplasmata archaeon HGW-Thermoplasmata-1]|nr:MAG: hypothetical protein CVT48_01815 [Thermoplasmata archaeon HGW-Thermoplasmata-1]
MEAGQWIIPLIAALVTLLVNTLFIHFAASTLVKGRQRFRQALLVALLGSAAAGLLLGLIHPVWIGAVIAIAVWCAITAALYRTGLAKALLIGVVAGLISWGVAWVFELISQTA